MTKHILRITTPEEFDERVPRESQEKAYKAAYRILEYARKQIQNKKMSRDETFMMMQTIVAHIFVSFFDSSDQEEWSNMLADDSIQYINKLRDKSLEDLKKRNFH